MSYSSEQADHMTSKRIRLTLDYTTTEPHAASDARSAMARAIQAARAVTTQLDSGNARSLSPCSEWNALDVVRHMIAVIDRATAGATGQSLHGMPELVDVELVDVDDAFAESSRALRPSPARSSSLFTPPTSTCTPGISPLPSTSS